jgi:hypothetical protein
MMRNPSDRQSRTATKLDSTTALNCIAAYLRSRAHQSACSPSARPTPRPRASPHQEPEVLACNTDPWVDKSLPH